MKTIKKITLDSPFEFEFDSSLYNYAEHFEHEGKEYLSFGKQDDDGNILPIGQPAIYELKDGSLIKLTEQQTDELLYTIQDNE